MPNHVINEVIFSKIPSATKIAIQQEAAQNYFPGCKAAYDGPAWVILDSTGETIASGSTEDEAWNAAGGTAAFLYSYKATGGFVPVHAEEPVDEESTWSTVFALVSLGLGGVAAIVGCGYLAYLFLRFMAHLAAHNPWGFAVCFVPLTVLAVGLIRSREEC